jgi:hypothetical protein
VKIKSCPLVRAVCCGLILGGCASANLDSGRGNSIAGLGGAEGLVLSIIDEMKNASPAQGYSGAPIFENRITLVVKGKQVLNLNEFGNQFEDNGIDLKWSEISKVNRFIGFISRNASKYRDSTIDLYYVYSNIGKLPNK